MLEACFLNKRFWKNGEAIIRIRSEQEPKGQHTLRMEQKMGEAEDVDYCTEGDDVEAVVVNLKIGKVLGRDNTRPELIKYGGQRYNKMPHVLFQRFGSTTKSRTNGNLI